MKVRMEIPFKSNKEASNAYKALVQETEFKKRSITIIQAKKKNLVITVESNELSALRATVNSYMRLLKLMSDITLALR
ncbi:hypothetical protein HY570_02610 [Candidatus Micrarchaeota archaeon]|nr:hypothetical protein [Candidatus Micrarchaeota archaeon]